MKVAGKDINIKYFSINGRFCLVSLKNPTFSNIFPRAKHVLMTFEFWTLCACLSIFSLYIFHLLLSSQPSPIDMWTISYPSPDDGYWNRNVNVDFTSWYIHLFGLYFFLLPSYCRILSIFTFILSFRKKHIPNTSWYIHLFGLYFFLLPSYIYIYIYIYIYKFLIIQKYSLQTLMSQN